MKTMRKQHTSIQHNFPILPYWKLNLNFENKKENYREMQRNAVEGKTDLRACVLVEIGKTCRQRYNDVISLKWFSSGVLVCYSQI
jgi:hypothetical protein